MKINDQTIDTVNSTTFLGVKIENSLSWSTHINYISNKISKSIGALKKGASILNHETMIKLYSSLIDPYIQYCNIIWGNAPNVHLNRILLLQKRAIRIAEGIGYRDHTGTHFIENNILRIKDAFKLSCSIFLYKLNKTLYPAPIIFHFYDAIFTHVGRETGLRSAFRNEVRVQRCRTALRMNTFTICSAKLYNEFILPYDAINSSTSLSSFKKLIKCLIISEYS